MKKSDVFKSLGACALAILSLAAFAAEPGVWDFTKGVPADGGLRTKAKMTDRGLVSTDEKGGDNAGGFALKGKMTYPEAFRFEAEVVFAPTAGVLSHNGVLWDDMYINYDHPQRPNRGLMVTFSRYAESVTPIVYVGLGKSTYTVRGPGAKIVRSEPMRFVLVFDGNGGVAMELNGERSESSIAQMGPVLSGPHAPVIGDRVSSTFWKFEGAVRRVALTPLKREPLTAAVSGRRAFERGETDAALDVVVASPVAAATGVRATVRQLDAAGREVRRGVAGPWDLAAGGTVKFACPVETRLKPGATSFVLELSGKDAAGQNLTAKRTLTAAIGPTYAERMTTLMWMHSAPHSVVVDYGFTHGIGPGMTGPLHNDSDADSLIRSYDKALASGLKLTKYVKVQYPEKKKASDYYRLGRDGQPSNDWHKEPVPEVSHPDMIAWAGKGSEADVQVLKDHPAFGGALAVSENRDHTFPSYNTEQNRYRQATGAEPPPEAVKKVCDAKYAKARFPDGVVPEDDPVLRYYRWFWNGGDGWPAYLSAIADGYRRGGYGRFEDGSALQKKRPFFTFHDPAVRCPAIWGSGGDVDCLNQWCYANPEPMNVAGPVEEMFAMAEGRPGQQVMIMTQLICYRNQLAPKNVKVDPEPDWMKRRPGADFPSIPPDTLQEATWSMIAKPVRGIMYHGWGCIYETGATNGYTYTNAETTDRIKHLLKDVVAPLGPSLLKIGRAKNPVAILESGTTAIMGGPASWGWTAPAITFLQRARLDPRVVYEEAVEKGALDDGGVKVLYAPQLQYTTPKVVAKIRAFQAKGGIFVGDAQTLKALKPDVVAPLVSFSAPPASDHTDDVDAMEKAKGTDLKTRSATVNAKRIMQRQADEIRAALAQKGYVPASDSSSSELVVYNRRWRDTPYLFAINDKRTFGDYVGQWGRTMEKGLPFDGKVTLAGAAKATGAVYELSRGGKVAFEKTAGDVVVPLSYETNDGRMLVFLPEEIGELKVDAPADVPAGGLVSVTVTVLGKSGKPVPAVLPVEVRLRDAHGQELDGAGYAAAEDGVCKLRIRTNLDDPEGEYCLVCRDRASGLTVTKKIFRGKLSWWKRLFRSF